MLAVYWWQVLGHCAERDIVSRGKPLPRNFAKAKVITGITVDSLQACLSGLRLKPKQYELGPRSVIFINQDEE